MLTDGLECCGLLWCFYQTLILTAPIHCRASIAETLMQRHISTNLMKKQTHPDLSAQCHFWVNCSFKCRLTLQPHKLSLLQSNLPRFLEHELQNQIIYDTMLAGSLSERLSALQLNTFTELWTAVRFSWFHSTWFFSRKSVRVPLSTGISRYSTPSAPWHTNNAVYISTSVILRDVTILSISWYHDSITVQGSRLILPTGRSFVTNFLSWSHEHIIWSQFLFFCYNIWLINACWWTYIIVYSYMVRKVFNIQPVLFHQYLWFKFCEQFLFSCAFTSNSWSWCQLYKKR